MQQRLTDGQNARKPPWLKQEYRPWRRHTGVSDA